MVTINFSNNGSTPFERLIGHNTKVLEQWLSLEKIFFNDISLPPDLLEQVRRALAFKHECEYCMVKAGRPEFNEREIKTSLAVAFAESYANDYKSITIKHFDLLKQYFTDKEISELCAFIVFIAACQHLGRIFNLTEEHQVNAATSMLKIRSQSEII